MSQFQISTIIATYQDAQNLKQLLHSIVNARSFHSAIEIIVVDDGSIDHTKEVVSEFANVVYLFQENNGPSSARNKAAQIAQGSLLVFLDSDTLVESDFFNFISEEQFIGNESYAAMGGMQLEHIENSLFGKEIHRFLSFLGFVTEYVQTHSELKAVEHNPSCVVCYKKRPFLENNGFNENLFPGEDVELDRRLSLKGYRFLFSPKLKVQHKRPESYGDFIKMMKSYGSGSAKLTRMHGVFRRTQIITLLILFGFLFIAFCLLFNKFLFLVSLLVLILFGILFAFICSKNKEIRFLTAFNLLIITVLYYPLSFFIHILKK